MEQIKNEEVTYEIDGGGRISQSMQNVGYSSFGAQRQREIDVINLGGTSVGYQFFDVSKHLCFVSGLTTLPWLDSIVVDRRRR